MPPARSLEANPRIGTCFFVVALLASLAAAQETRAPVTPEAGYAVGPTDVLGIEVFNEEELSSEYTVSSDGQIVFPLIGFVPVDGKTSIEIERLLTEMLEEDYLYDATVSVTVRSFRSRTVKVLGSVVRPGVYYLEGPTRLLDVLSLAGGVASDTGEVTRGQAARVVRVQQVASPAEGQPTSITETVYVDLYDLLVGGAEGSNLLLESGDTVYVPETMLVHVVGEVKKPDSFPFEVGMTVLKAITLAGGATSKGAPRNAVVKRIRDGRELQIEVSLEDTLQPDDIVEVPRSFW